MIKILKVQVTKFRGIQKLHLDLKGKSFGILGNNGTGKSGVIDAIEFALSGRISRLSGSGTKGLNAKTHGPHVDARDSAHESAVFLELQDVLSKKTFSVKRSPADPNTPTIEPNETFFHDLIRKIGEHPEFALSRKEILRYVSIEPGMRAKQIQVLLKLEKLDSLRAAFTRWKSESKTNLKSRTLKLNEERGKLQRRLGLDGTGKIKQDEILFKINESRKILGLEEIIKLEANTKVNEGIVNDKNSLSDKLDQEIGKVRLNYLAEKHQQLFSNESQAKFNKLKEFALQLTSDVLLIENIKKQQLLEAGLELIKDDMCPLCSLSFDQQKLAELLDQRLKKSKEANTILDSIRREGEALSENLADLSNTVTELIQAIDKEADTKLHIKLQGIAEDLRNRGKQLADTNNIEIWIAALGKEILKDFFNAEMKNILMEKIDKLPNLTAKQKAIEILHGAEERLSSYRDARKQELLWKSKYETAEKVLSHFEVSCSTLLNGIYEDLEKEFSSFYAFINNDDEKSFSAKLKAMAGALEFSVDFFGRGHFSPLAYHSEGHQDSMGLCLYFSLMKKTFGELFSFALLDDVLTSIDLNHRRQFCALLKNEFPNTQFIFTTHDKVWLSQMKADGVVEGKQVCTFRKWTVSDGPTIIEDKPIWNEIDEALSDGNIKSAAHCLRISLEEISYEVATRIMPKIKFTPSGNYDLGDLLPEAVSKFGKLLDSAIQAAESWENSEDLSKLKNMKSSFEKTRKELDVERWAINPNVHYNEWANFSEADFKPVANAAKALSECFRCTKCNAYNRVDPARGSAENLRCDCKSFTLLRKTKENTKKALN